MVAFFLARTNKAKEMEFPAGPPWPTTMPNLNSCILRLWRNLIAGRKRTIILRERTRLAFVLIIVIIASVTNHRHFMKRSLEWRARFLSLMKHVKIITTRSLFVSRKKEGFVTDVPGECCTVPMRIK